MRGLVDSGAEVSVIGADLNPQMRPEAAPIIRGVGGECLRTKGWGRIEVQLAGGVKEWLTGLVVAGDQIILGMPFLQEQKAAMFLDLGILVLKDTPYQLETLRKRKEMVNIHEIITDPDLGECKTREAEREVNLFESTVFSEDAQARILHLIRGHPELFSETMGTVELVEHDIELCSEGIINDKLRRYSDSQKVIIERELEKMLAEGVIRDSKSPYASAVVLVKKSAGDWRFCIDYRQLNRHTKKDKYPLPFMRDLLFGVKKQSFFIALDLRAGYWQIPLKKSAIEKTAFRTHKGLFEFLVMPFGLVNAPATFQRFMDKLLGDLYWQGVSCYLDDILMGAETEEECLRLFEEVVKRLSKAGCRVKLSKCQFGPKELVYLGFLLGEGCLKPVAEKVKCIEELMSPRCQRELRSALGLLGFYRPFIPGFGSIAAPLNELLTKGVKFEWTARHEEAFRKLTSGLANRTLQTVLDSTLR